MERIVLLKRDNIILIFFVSIFVIGLFIILNSINLGDNEASSILRDNGGVMDQKDYLIYLEHSITKYICLGSILSIFGGIGVLNNIENIKFE